MGKLTGRVAIVTGGSRGIGKAISEKLAKEGARIVIAATTLDVAEEATGAINAAGGEAIAMQTDVTDFGSVKQTVEQTINTFGRVDILVNNAGGSARGKMSLFCDSEEETWRHVLDTNMMGVFYACRSVINHMQERGEGAIINIGSVAGMIGLASQVDYSASKGAVIAFTQALAKETASRGVRVNCVSPGPIKSDAIRDIPPEMRDNLAFRQLVDSTGLGDFGEPEDIANLVALLASDEGKFITGQNYAVCGLMNLGLNTPLAG
ncbi:SDR family NAD(P)-dependent oxidoreductase [Pontixanthobacter aquaemixtae]|uniref:Glucose 1-dehydrogenase n=1 Tax=Pontixanthobacter aquaemixtae TaxID=1958940 RepID=A0A844ZWM4_9SPHN|nr:3-oxoacyl-ACP reductase family protein [Pontixanthobacter aquaemixtae]MXO89899.1 glucose 1-dehydrogenase [Pontixanthobacter aquaemixtae]